MANYHRSSAFDQPYLSCNDYCDQWIFQKKNFIIIFSLEIRTFPLRVNTQDDFVLFLLVVSLSLYVITLSLYLDRFIKTNP